MNNLNSEIKFLIKPVSILLTLSILIISTILIGINQYSSVTSKIEDSKNVQLGLNKKLGTLQSIPDALSGDTTFLDVALPHKTAVLYGTSQIKLQSTKNNLVVSNIKTGAATEESGTILKTPISFDVEGDESSIYDFFQSFKKVLPLMNISRVKVSKSGSATRASALLNVYSADLPKTIPSISSSVNELTAEEIKTLKDISQYTLPTFIEPEVQTITPKADPFN